MRRFALFSLFVFQCFNLSNLQAQCAAGFDSVRLEINPDFAYYEVSWSIYDKNNPANIYETGTLLSDSLYVFNYCIPQGDCKVFHLADDNGDGMFPDGVYRLYVNGILRRESVGYYGAGQTTDFGCPAGSVCNSPLPMSLGTSVTPDSAETWYRFVPAETGLFEISTCGAACPAKIWIYDRCNGIIISENLVGTIFYADAGCPDSSSALATVQLGAGIEYFIRIRYAAPGCSPDPIAYTVTYLGPIMGCMDPNACNYNPLATVGSDCLYPGDPNCPQAPDIAIDEALLRSSLELGDQASTDPCQVEEGCLRGFGNRHVIKFDTRISNIGNADFYVGIPPADQNATSTQFVYDPCHGHWHYLGYAEYILFNSAGKRIPIGSKNGFCILDAGCGLGFGPTKYKCNNMGITAGCFDVYDKVYTPCQWIDITGIPADNYTLVARVNWDRSPDKIGRVEKTFDNNWAQACFTLNYDGQTPDVLFNTDSCKQYTDCTGELFGNAQQDCNGVCNGPALFGDLNQDTLRTLTDIEAYETASLNDNGEASSCYDLDEDGDINVFDAALLQECALHADSQHYWIQRFPCEFPGGIFNATDLVNIRPGTLDTLAKTFDLEMANPYNGVMGYELSVSGILIDSVENLISEYQTAPKFNPNTGEILALARDESNIGKHFSPTAFLRVHYSKLTAPEVCISKITAVVNHKYHRSNATLDNPNCIPVNYVAVHEPHNAAFKVYVQPNPMVARTTLYFENPNDEPVDFILTDLTGRTLRSFNNLYGESLTIERENLPEGTYLFTFRCSRGTVSGKLLIR